MLSPPLTILIYGSQTLFLVVQYHLLELFLLIGIAFSAIHTRNLRSLCFKAHQPLKHLASSHYVAFSTA